MYRWIAEGSLHVVGARRGDRVRAEPFGAIELQVGVFFGDDEEDEPDAAERCRTLNDAQPPRRRRRASLTRLPSAGLPAALSCERAAFMALPRSFGPCAAVSRTLMMSST